MLPHTRNQRAAVAGWEETPTTMTSTTHPFVPPSDEDLLRSTSILQGELSRLRESTASALRQAWDEVECVLRTSAAKDDEIDALRKELAESKEREREWKAKYEDAKGRMMEESRRRFTWAGTSDREVAQDGERQEQTPPPPQQQGRGPKRTSLLRSLGRRFSNFDDCDDDDEQESDQEQESTPTPAETSSAPPTKTHRRRASWIRGPPAAAPANRQEEDEERVPGAREISLTSLASSSGGSGRRDRGKAGGGGFWNFAHSSFSSEELPLPAPPAVDKPRRSRQADDKPHEKQKQQQQQKQQVEEEEEESNELELAELRMALTHRDTAISSLEDSAEFKSRELDELRARLDRYKADELQREAEADEMRRKLKSRKKVIVDQRRKEKECREYIQELARELERYYNLERRRNAEEKEEGGRRNNAMEKEGAGWGGGARTEEEDEAAAERSARFRSDRQRHRSPARGA